MRLISKYIGVLFFCVVFYVNAAEPPYILQEQSLSFGRLAVVPSATVTSISIDADGKMTAGKGVYIIELGHPAQFLMINYPPYTQFNLSVFIADTETTTGATASNQFTLKEISQPLTITTDSNGSASFSVGGTLETSGDISQTYYDTLYQARFVISVNY